MAELTNRVQAEISEMLQAMKSRPGRVDLKVEIGRILVEPNALRPEFSKRSFDVAEWTAATRSTGLGHFSTEFTTRLSTDSSDAAAILNTRISHGARLFAEQHGNSLSSFHITCKTRGGEEIAVTVRLDKSFSIRGTTTTSGAVNLHYPKRVWDTRFQVNSDTILGGSYEAEVQYMIKSFVLPKAPITHAHELSIRTRNQGLQIMSVQLKRERTYPGHVLKDLRLHLTEVQDLQMKQSSADLDQYSIVLEAQDDLKRKHRLWLECAISSHSIASALRENETLELGEIAKWDAAKIVSRNVISDMFHLAQNLVTRMDYVGAANTGHAGSGSKSTPNYKSGPSFEPPTGPPGYW